MSTEQIVDSKGSKEAFDLEDLQFMRIRIPEAVRLIPALLIESVKGRLFSLEEFYQRQEAQVHLNENNHLYVLLDPKGAVRGYFWAVLEPGHCLWINTFSICKEFWGKGAAIRQIVQFAGELNQKLKCPVVQWCTTNPRFFEKHGFRRSRNVVMEFSNSKFES